MRVSAVGRLRREGLQEPQGPYMGIAPPKKGDARDSSWAWQAHIRSKRNVPTMCLALVSAGRIRSPGLPRKTAAVAVFVVLPFKRASLVSLGMMSSKA